MSWIVEEYVNDPLVLSTNSLRFATEYLKTVAWVRDHPSDWKLPLLMLYGSEESFVSLEDINQFFGGLGGEEQAGLPLEERAGAIGPGRLLEQTLGEGATVVTTLICGDNYAAENMDELTEQVLAKVNQSDAGRFVAGPCFEAGRYGVAAGHLCAAVQGELGIPVVAAMAEENPGVDLYRQDLCIVDSGANAASMREAMIRIAALAHKLVNGQPVGRPNEDGYFPRGILRDEAVEQTSAERLVAMALAAASGLGAS